MTYRTGRVGRVVVARFNDGEDLLEGLREIARKEDIRSGVCLILGGLKKGEFVVGPEGDDLPPKPMWRKIETSHEVIGLGTIFWDDTGPKVHLHGSYARADDVKLGCLRQSSEVFLVIEAIVLEIEGINAKRVFEPEAALALLNFID
ncbi:MAG: DNA-binding protein [Nitrospirae bacterium]|nr:MAG: DNA-binding protein [Nitrospirota bacterium]